MALLVSVCLRAVASGDGEANFRVGFATSMFTDVNENDARAAVKAWARTIALERHINVDPEARIFADVNALRQSLTNGLVDAVGVTMIEFEALRDEVTFSPVFLTYNAGVTTEQYVLLARQGSSLVRPGDLSGRDLVIHDNARACLAPIWLDSMLARQNLPPIRKLAGKVRRETRLSNVVLPVFFGQNDACLVELSGFNTLCELNPQIGRQLKIVATSPAVVPAVFCFRADYEPVFKSELIQGIVELHKSPSGQQVLTIFHSEKIEESTITCLDSALELLSAREKSGLAAVSGAAE